MKSLYRIIISVLVILTLSTHVGASMQVSPADAGLVPLPTTLTDLFPEIVDFMNPMKAAQTYIAAVRKGGPAEGLKALNIEAMEAYDAGMARCSAYLEYQQNTDPDKEDFDFSQEFTPIDRCEGTDYGDVFASGESFTIAEAEAKRSTLGQQKEINYRSCEEMLKNISSAYESAYKMYDENKRLLARQKQALKELKEVIKQTAETLKTQIKMVGPYTESDCS